MHTDVRQISAYGRWLWRGGRIDWVRSEELFSSVSSLYRSFPLIMLRLPYSQPTSERNLERKIPPPPFPLASGNFLFPPLPPSFQPPEGGRGVVFKDSPPFILGKLLSRGTFLAWAFILFSIITILEKMA